MIIKLENATKRIKGNTVIDHISMTMQSGVIYGLEGCNGSGKTMLMRLITGLIYPDTGNVRINNSILGKDIDFPKNVGMLLENPCFLDEFTGIQNLNLLAQLNGRISQSQIEKTLQRVGLNPRDKRTYQKYSLGMKQRLGLAAAIMELPDLILLDEPTNALDADGLIMLKKLILDEHQRGAMLIIASHDCAFLESIAHVIFQLQSGRLTNTRRMR